MTEKLIQKALLQAFHSHEYKFTNVFFFENESDWLSFLTSGYCYEVEIKISRADFKADFKKIKHKIQETKNIGNEYFTQKGIEHRISNPTWEQCRDFPKLIEAVEHYRGRGTDMGINLYLTHSTSVYFQKFSNEKLPNKFFYAVPKGLISKEDVPDYAGLIYINEDLTITKVKDGKFIHRDILDKTKIWNKTYYSYAREMAQKLNNEILETI